MPNLDELFDPKSNRPSHPQLRELESLIAGGGNVECAIERRREGFIFRPAIIYVYTKSADGSTQVDPFGWDATLNAALIEHGIKAVDQDNEGLRFSMMLRSELQSVEIRYGEGYFNAVVLEYVQQTFGTQPDIAAIIQKVGPGRPYQGKAYHSAKETVETAFSNAARTLSDKLKYDPTSGKRILVRALKLYLDERFSVTPGDLLNIGTAAAESRTGPTRPNLSRVIIFDTNAYRNFTFGLSLDESRAKAVKLRDYEKKAGVAILAHPIAIWELLTHLVDETDPAYSYCLNALVALGEHSASRSRMDGGIDIIADALSTVCRELFGRLPPGYEEGLQNLGTLVTHITKNAPNISDPIARQNIQMLGRGMTAKEESWLHGMKTILSHFSPEVVKQVLQTGTSTDSEALKKMRAYFDQAAFFETWSQHIVVSNAVAVGLNTLTTEEIKDKASIVRNLFPVPFKLMCNLLKKLATPQSMNLDSPRSKRWNFVWDSMIAFSVGSGTIEDAPVFLITADKEIISAAQAAGYGEQVLLLDDYLKSVGFA